MSIIKLVKQIPDSRVTGRVVHKMEHIVYITIAAVIAGAQSWNDIEELGKSKFDFFKKRLPDMESIPSHDTFNLFFSIFDPKGFEEIFRNWVKEIIGEVKGVHLLMQYSTILEASQETFEQSSTVVTASRLPRCSKPSGTGL